MAQGVEPGDPGWIEEWQFDRWNTAHLARHGVTSDVVREVALSGPRFIPTPPHPRRSSSHRMIGAAADGRCWTIAIVRVEDEAAAWRAITGWPSTRKEERHYREQTEP